MPGFLFPDMRVRNVTDKEMMEYPDIDLQKFRRSVRQFKVINFLFSSSRRLIGRYFFTVMEQEPERNYTLLEIGSGGCDTSVWIAREARKRGLKLKITALDNDERILPVAFQASGAYPEISVVNGNALDLSSLGQFDFLFSSHLMHHLSWDELKILLREVIAGTRLAFVMNDLKRSNWAYLGFTIFSGIFLPGSFHFHDGRLSIRRAFLPEEIRDFLAINFPDTPIQVVETCPARVVLVHTL
ncbi:MAG: hypothetical protein A2079_06190 [Geobacteraceae bacterium GWC2_48_7]|nr:MAG: hypothetical protein A2079_06190 [Geobacteraceae bacterium GWC2_48_7]